MIGGNLTLNLIKINEDGKNTIGESVKSDTPYMSHAGYLDMMSGDTASSNYNTAITESTHIFICDYFDIGIDSPEKVLRGEIGDDKYDIKYIDNPMNLNEHLEIYLRYAG